jgi:hypothetical protein
VVPAEYFLPDGFNSFRQLFAGWPFQVVKRGEFSGNEIDFFIRSIGIQDVTIFFNVGNIFFSLEIMMEGRRLLPS